MYSHYVHHEHIQWIPKIFWCKSNNFDFDEYVAAFVLLLSENKLVAVIFTSGPTFWWIIVLSGKQDPRDFLY